MAWYEWETDRRRPRDSNYAGIERALGIAAGSIEAYMTDGTVPVSAATAADTEDPRQVIDRRLRQKRAELVEVLINDDDDPRADEIMTEIQRLVDERNGLSGKDQVSGE